MVDSEYPTEKTLWQMAKRGTRRGEPVDPSIGSAATSCPDAMDLSAWLDGHPTERVASQIELHLAHCPACVDAVLELRALVAQDAHHRATPPQAVLDRAKAIIAPDGQAHTRTQRATVPAILAWPQWAIGAAKWAAAAMFVLAVTYGGFMAGLQTSRYLDDRSTAGAKEIANENAAALAKEGPLGLDQADATDQDELLAMAEAD